MSCQDCISGQRHDGEPQGKINKLHGLDTYIAEPANGRQAKGAIIIIPDAFGMEFVNNKLLADTYASKGGYKVYLPDFMRGRSCSTYLLDAMAAVMSPEKGWLTKLYHIFWGAYTFIPWRYYNSPSRTFPVVKKFFQDFRREEGFSKPLGVAGFCWGGKHTILLSHQENFVEAEGTSRPLLDAGFTGHPSFLDLPTDVEKITVPIAWALPEMDHHIKVPQVADMIAKIVENKPDEQKGELKIYYGCRHGFCVRADVLSGDVTNQAVEAEDQAIEWFDAKLGPRSGL